MSAPTTTVNPTSSEIDPMQDLLGESFACVISPDPAKILDADYIAGRQVAIEDQAWLSDSSKFPPVVIYDSAFLETPSRAFSMQFLAQWSASLYQAVQEVSPNGFSQALSAKSQNMQIFFHLFGLETLELIRSLGTPCLQHLRSAGLHVMEEGKLNFNGVSAIAQEGLQLAQGGAIRINPELCKIISEEAACIAPWCARIITEAFGIEGALFKGNEAKDLAGMCDKTGVLMCYALAIAVGRLSDDEYKLVSSVTPLRPSGLAPLHRLFDIDKIKLFRDCMAEAWVTSKRFEPAGQAHPGLQAYQHTGCFSATDRLFQTLLAVGKLRVYTRRGHDVLSYMGEQGLQAVEIGIDFEASKGRDPARGIVLIDGSKLVYEPRVINLLALELHANWVLTRNFINGLVAPELRQTARREHENWNPRACPDDRYIPDKYRALCDGIAIASLSAAGRENENELLRLIHAAARPDFPADNKFFNRFSRDSIERILPAQATPLPPLAIVTAQEFDDLIKTRFHLAFLWGEEREQGALTHPAQRGWEPLNARRMLFERIYGGAIIDIIGRLGPVQAEELKILGGTLIAHPLALDKRAINFNEPLPLAGGFTVQMSPHTLHTMAARDNSAWHLAEQQAFDMADKLRRGDLRPPGRIDELEGAEQATITDRNRGNAHGIAFWLAAISSNHTKILEHARLYHARCPAATTIGTFAEMFSWDFANWFSLEFYRVREAFKAGVLKSKPAEEDAAVSWETLAPADRLMQSLYGPAVLHLAVCQGQESLAYLRKQGKLMLAGDPIAPQGGRLSRMGNHILHTMLLNIGDEAVLATGVVEEIAEQLRSLNIRTRQLCNLISLDVNDKSLKFKVADRDEPISSHVDLDRDRVTVYALALTLGLMTDAQFELINKASYFSGRNVGFVHWQTRARYSGFPAPMKGTEIAEEMRKLMRNTTS